MKLRNRPGALTTVTEPRGVPPVGSGTAREIANGETAGVNVASGSVSRGAERIGSLARTVEIRQRGQASRIRRILVAAGSACASMGIVAIVLGWFGAAHSPYLFQEVPYLISGGLLGVALVGAGSALLVVAWLMRLIEAVDRQSSASEKSSSVNGTRR